MATDDVYIADSTQKKLAYEEQLFREMEKKEFFGANGMASTGYNSIIHVDNEFTKSTGDSKQSQLVYELEGDGVTEGQRLEGNEEELRVDTNTITISEYRHAVKAGTVMQDQRVFWSIDRVSKEKLVNWGARKHETLKFAALQDSVTNTAFGGGKASRAALTTGDTMDSESLRKVRIAAMTGGNDTFERLRPVRINGKDYYVLIIHPDQEYDLLADSTFREAQKYAAPRSADNPLINNALAVVEGLIIYSSEYINIGSDAGAGGNLPYASSLVLGAGALTQLNGKRGKIVTKMFDYDNETRHAISMYVGYGKTKFLHNNAGSARDFGVISFETLRTDASGFVS